MSAQIITALRARADCLDGEADRLEADGTQSVSAPERDLDNLRFLASEFRALADAAEAGPRYQPGGGS